MNSMLSFIFVDNRFISTTGFSFIVSLAWEDLLNRTELRQSNRFVLLTRLSLKGSTVTGAIGMNETTNFQSLLLQFNFCGVMAQQSRWGMQQNAEHLLQLLGTKRIHAIFYCRQTTLCCNDLTQCSKVADVVDMLGYALTERRIWFLPEVGLPSNKAGVLRAINLQADFLYVFRHKISWTLLNVWIGSLWFFSSIETLCEALIFPATFWI